MVNSHERTSSWLRVPFGPSSGENMLGADVEETIKVNSLNSKYMLLRLTSHLLAYRLTSSRCLYCVCLSQSNMKRASGGESKLPFTKHKVLYWISSIFSLFCYSYHAIPLVQVPYFLDRITEISLVLLCFYICHMGVNFLRAMQITQRLCITLSLMIPKIPPYFNTGAKSNNNKNPKVFATAYVTLMSHIPTYYLNHIGWLLVFCSWNIPDLHLIFKELGILIFPGPKYSMD